ncbi:diguanylate cyclase [Sulfuricurvum kujiense DSM 16994]|uniref:diguanylate cyclase n=1 Tax=Sulfuricurvum kujiense (strain ATCC BAA-921 / DSM 16994 / JCM 11577 / YK-1) TaxID=709032 RepID=E4U0T8_SULKY|nr:diguanylate cyclase [Sulfuricurvum kujiense]ADR33314.1 diguanylate cyclase [Sulfuricurvum kujiense DSM 16994]
MNLKLRAQLIIAFIVIVTSAALTFYHISQERRYIKERTERSSENIKLAFDTIVADTEQLYRFRTRVTMETEGVMDAMKRRDSDALYRAVLPRYNALHEENHHLIIMQFHAPDGRSILRVHLKEKFGDDIAAKRPMLREIHSEHKMVTGFEGGLGGIAFRVIMPIFDHGEYIGALEYGVDSGYFVDRIKHLTGSDSMVLIHKDWFGAADKKKYTDGIGQYYFSNVLNERKELISRYAFKNPSLEPRHIDLEGNSYEINPLFLKDAKNRNLGMIIAIDDVTGVSQNTADTIIDSLTVTAIMLIVLWGLIEYTFGGLIKKVNLQERYIKTILDSQKNIVVVTDGKALIFANQAFYDYFGYHSLDKFRDDHSCICDFFESGESDEYLQPKIDGLLWTDYLIQYDMKEQKVKMTVGEKTSIFTVHAKRMEYAGEIRHVVVFTDITKLNQLATQDVLTQVANRFQFDNVLEHSISLAQRYGRTLSILLIDIDFFKEVNDTYGHLIGDDVLKKLAHTLNEGIRKSDVIARWGGEEFVILLPDSELSSALKLAETLRAKVAETDFEPVVKITCSIGVARWNEGENSDQLLKRVDEKLYTAKENGRNRVVS